MRFCYFLSVVQFGLHCLLRVRRQNRCSSRCWPFDELGFFDQNRSPPRRRWLMADESFTVSLRMWHPSLSAEEIVGVFGFSPEVSQSVGDPRVTPLGHSLGGTYQRTEFLDTHPFSKRAKPQCLPSAMLRKLQQRSRQALKRARNDACPDSAADGRCGDRRIITKISWLR